MKARAREIIRGNPYLHRALRLVGRLRWVTKTRLVRRSSASPLRHLGYVLWDPELESFSYHLANPAEVAERLAEAFGLPSEVIRGYMREYDEDPELHARLRERVRWRPWFKRDMGPGKRAAWYPLVRALKPELIVETGIHDGFGSLILLRALARNAIDGRPGTLISVDLSPFSGELVAPRLRGGWERVIGHSSVVLEPAVGRREISILFQDTDHSRENQMNEYGVALRHAAGRLLLWDPSGGASDVLGHMAAASGSELRSVTPVAKDHFWAVRQDNFLLLEQAHLERLRDTAFGKRD